MLRRPEIATQNVSENSRMSGQDKRSPKDVGWIRIAQEKSAALLGGCGLLAFPPAFIAVASWQPCGAPLALRQEAATTSVMVVAFSSLSEGNTREAKPGRKSLQSHPLCCEVDRPRPKHGGASPEQVSPAVKLRNRPRMMGLAREKVSFTIAASLVGRGQVLHTKRDAAP